MIDVDIIVSELERLPSELLPIQSNVYIIREDGRAIFIQALVHLRYCAADSSILIDC